MPARRIVALGFIETPEISRALLVVTRTASARQASAALIRLSSPAPITVLLKLALDAVALDLP